MNRFLKAGHSGAIVGAVCGSAIGMLFILLFSIFAAGAKLTLNILLLWSAIGAVLLSALGLVIGLVVAFFWRTKKS